MWLILLGYTGIVIFAALHHEMWRDEVRALSIATEGSLRDMFGELRYEGHPAVWYLLLRAAHALTGSQYVLPVLSLMTAITTMYLVLRYAPFSWAQKVLIVLGVFPLFDYSVMARNYGLGMLVIVILGVLYPTRFAHPLRWALLLGLLAGTSAHAAIVAIAFLCGWSFEWIQRWRQRHDATGLAINRRAWLGIAIATAAIVAVRLGVATGGMPPGVQVTETSADSALLTRRGLVRRAASAALHPALGLTGLVPSPMTPTGDDVAQTTHTPARRIAVDLFLLALLIGVWGEWPLLIIGGAAVVGTSVFFRLYEAGSVRHLGLLWMLFLVLYWQTLRNRPRASGRVTWALTAPLTAVMLLQAIEGVRQVWQDLRSPMSASAAMGTLLQQPEYRDATVVAASDNLLEALPYYGARRLFFVDQRRYETHVHFGWQYFSNQSLANALAAGDSLQATTAGPILVIVSADSLPNATPAERKALQDRAVEIANFTPAVTDEAYRVYRLKPLPRDSAANAATGTVRSP